MLLLAARLRLIIWDLAKSPLLRTAIAVFSLILVYAVGQVNVIAASHIFKILRDVMIDLCINNINIRKVFTCVARCGNVTLDDGVSRAAKAPEKFLEDHRWCPLPHYVVHSAILSLLGVALFLRLPITLKGALLFIIGSMYSLLILITHAHIFDCYDLREPYVETPIIHYFYFYAKLNSWRMTKLFWYILSVLISSKIVSVLEIWLFLFLILAQSSQIEWMGKEIRHFNYVGWGRLRINLLVDAARLDFVWQWQALTERQEMEALQQSNKVSLGHSVQSIVYKGLIGGMELQHLICPSPSQ